jgi:hypothetical protein
MLLDIKDRAKAVQLYRHNLAGGIKPLILDPICFTFLVKPDSPGFEFYFSIFADVAFQVENLEGKRIVLFQ